MLAEPQTAIIPMKLDARSIAEWAKGIQQSIVEIRKTVLHEGSDYGKIPGTNKDVLLKPGAEKMSSAFKLYPVPKLLTGVEDWKDGFFFYRYQIDMIHRETGEVWGSGIGSCNSREKKYAWRWVTEAELPAGIDRDTLLKENQTQTLTEFTFAVDKSETSGQWGKSAEYWQQFKDAIAAGKARKVQKEQKNGQKRDAWEITTGVVRYRIPNPEICDLVNTIDKMAYKRAYVAAVLIATNASEFFTQDMEDFMNLALPDEDVIEGQVVDVTPPAPKPEPAPEEPPAPWYAQDELCRLADRCHANGFIGQAGCDGIPAMEALIAPRTWSDFVTITEAATAIKTAFDELKLELAKAQVSTEAAKNALKTETGSSTRKPPEPVITDPAAAALVNGDVKPGVSPFDLSKPQVNPDTGAFEYVNGTAKPVLEPPF